VSLARATLQRCGVRAWDTRLDFSGDDDRPAAVTRRSDPGLDALSQAEFRVADAVAGGLTNRQVAASLLISVKTVDFHLQQMYRKLGIRSRTELAVRMANFEPTAKGDRHE
jgi:DNA-binding NarL/FixJ family response regulator